MINTSCRQFTKFISLMIVFLFVFSCIHLPAEAEEEADTDVLTGEQDAEKQRVKAEKQAKSRKVFDEIEAVSFEQILADPDNVERNVAFAKEMINKGELLSAASTLDRVLSVKSGSCGQKFS